MYPVPDGLTFLVQQTLSGTGVFNGTEYGRASLTLFREEPANKRLWFRAKRHGAASNVLQVTLTNPGGNYAHTTARLSGNMIELRLRTVGGSIVATAKEVADTVNSLPTFAFPIVADYDRTTDGDALVTPVVATPLTGGSDPRVEGRNG